MNETDGLSGSAQTPKMAPYRPNANGVVRSPEQAIALTEAQGVEIPDDILIAFITAWQRTDAEAEYFWRRHDRNPNRWYTWADFYNDKTGKIPVRYNAAILNSDESIVAHIAHELHELNGLRVLFEENGRLQARQLIRLIHPVDQGGLKGNLHDQAWEVADQLIAKMRKQTNG